MHQQTSKAGAYRQIPNCRPALGTSEHPVQQMVRHERKRVLGFAICVLLAQITMWFWECGAKRAGLLD
jgi:hypothetical protein